MSENFEVTRHGLIYRPLTDSEKARHLEKANSIEKSLGKINGGFKMRIVHFICYDEDLWPQHKVACGVKNPCHTTNLPLSITCKRCKVYLRKRRSK